jgi:multisubunit Na+/H+ antiporter MnhB subunit
MKRFLIVLAIDCAAIYVAFQLAYQAGGFWLGIAGAVAVVLYGLACYIDGYTR